MINEKVMTVADGVAMIAEVLPLLGEAPQGVKVFEVTRDDRRDPMTRSERVDSEGVYTRFDYRMNGTTFHVQQNIDSGIYFWTAEKIAILVNAELVKARGYSTIHPSQRQITLDEAMRLRYQVRERRWNLGRLRWHIHRAAFANLDFMPHFENAQRGEPLQRMDTGEVIAFIGIPVLFYEGDKGTLQLKNRTLILENTLTGDAMTLVGGVVEFLPRWFPIK